MDITKSNFKSEFAQIKAAISNATFLAIDCEFSGLNINSDTNVNPYDSYKQYYLKLKQNVHKFLVLQFGLCAFRYDENERKFKQKCYNFYLFPRPVNKSIPDQRFVCQASSIDFLANHDFNFNKVFKEGITYLNQSEETKYKDILDEKQKSRSNSAVISNNFIPIPDDDKPFIDETMKIIGNFLKTDQVELMLPQCNSFRRRLVYQTVKDKFGADATLETRVLQNKERFLFVQKMDTPEKLAQKEKLKYEASLAEIEDAVGFSRVIQHISDSRKLIVGHNLCLDFLHLIDKFLTPLPEDYDEFKECASCLFPNIIDTKYLANSSHFKELINNTVLCNMITTFKNKPFEIPEIIVDEDSEGYILDDNKEHEAGYDAFITGVSFLTMAKYLDKSDSYCSLSSKVLKPFLNKIFVLKLQDCSCINLNGIDPVPSRDHVLHITFPKEWKMYEITQLFSPFGNIHVAWLNEVSAYVALYKREQAAMALRTLSQSNSCKVISYASHQYLMHSHLPVAPSPTPAMRKKRESDLTANAFENKKRRRETCFGESSKPKFSSIPEETDEECRSIASRITKMFDENSAWD